MKNTSRWAVIRAMTARMWSRSAKHSTPTAGSNSEHNQGKSIATVYVEQTQNSHNCINDFKLQITAPDQSGVKCSITQTHNKPRVSF